MIIPQDRIFRPAVGYPGVFLRLLVCSFPSAVMFLVWEFRMTAFAAGADALGIVLALAGIMGAAVALIVGTPLYFFFKRNNWYAWWGFVIAAALPAPLIFLARINPFHGDENFSASYDNCLVMDRGVYTACGWIGLRQEMLELALFGGLAGLVFWGLLRFRKSPKMDSQPHPPMSSSGS
jgi:hypothetical protein